MEYVVLTIVAIVSFIVGRVTVKKFTPQKAEVLNEIREDAKTALNDRTQNRKDKILQLITDTIDKQRDLEECSGMITEKGIMRVEVETLLGVSSTTARKYLNLLENEDKIIQVGGSGRSVHYILK